MNVSQSFARKGGNKRYNRRERSDLDRVLNAAGFHHRDARWWEVDDATFAYLLAAVFAAGGLVSFSITSDGGALRVYAGVGPSSYVRYGHTGDQIQHAMIEVANLVKFAE